MKHEKCIDYTPLINQLLKTHHATLSKKMAYVLVLCIHQEPDVRVKVIEAAVRNEFSFVFSRSKKTYSDDFKETFRSVLIDALTKNFEKTQAEKHVYGQALLTVPSSEFQSLRLNFVFSPFNETSPKRDSTPKIYELIDNILKMQDKVASIEGYQPLTETHIANHSILEASIYGKKGRKSSVLLHLLSSFIILLLLEAGLVIRHAYSSDENDNAKVIPLALTAGFINIIILLAIANKGNQLIALRENHSSEAIESTKTVLTNIIPDLVTKTIVNNGMKTYTYELPVFVKPTPVMPNVISSTQTHPEFQIKAPKVKSRPSYFSGIFKTTPTKTITNEKPLTIDGVTYRRIYNKNNQPTTDFIGYTDDILNAHTTPDNKHTFRTHLDSPQIVAPKGKQGLVFMKHGAPETGFAQFKMKLHGDVRLLFKHVGDKQMNGETVRLYQLSESKTHNQMERMKLVGGCRV